MPRRVSISTPGQRTAAAVKGWAEFLEIALKKRLDTDRFTKFAPIIADRHSLAPIYIADLVLGTKSRKDYMIDSRNLLYIGALLKLRIVDIVSVLRVVYRYSTSHNHMSHATPPEESPTLASGHKKPKDKGPPPQKVARWGNSYSQEEFLFFHLSKTVNTDIRTGKAAAEVALLVSKWLKLFTDLATNFNGMLSPEPAAARQALLLLAVAVLENQMVQSVLSRPMGTSKVICRDLAHVLDAFIPNVAQAAHPDIFTRLNTFRTQTLPSFDPTTKKDDESPEETSYVNTLIGLENLQVPLVPSVNSRAGLYIYVNAALTGRPLIDDQSLFGYLHNRYQGDLQATATQLILAAFDVLATAVFRNEGPNMGQLLKSFVVNKVPLILVSLAQSSSVVYPFNAEYCISEALNQVDTKCFPTLSDLFELNNSSAFQDSVRQDFCFACQLHGLLSPHAIKTLLGEFTYQSLPDEGRYVKETLVQSCIDDMERTQKLIGELDSMNGNVGAAAEAVVEVLDHLCRHKETMSLKRLCAQLSSKPLSLDILLLFNKPQKILQPLCDVLDNWGGYDEDQGEYQPVYEEFGSILLLLFAFVYRYGLTAADLGRPNHSFVGKLLTKGHLARPLAELTEQEKNHMNDWIQALFDTEAGGLGDELMSGCLPQDFYLLLPTLFHQIVLALSAGNLTEEMLKGGLEYLVGVLLLPSLVPAIMFLANHLWADSQGQKAVIRILQLILVSHSHSPEASTMLSSVLNIVAKPLEQALGAYQRQEPQSQEVEPLLRALKDNLPLSRRTGAASNKELTTPTPGTVGLSLAIRQTVQSLVHWAQNSPMNSMSVNYTHRQIFAALKLYGAGHLLAILLEELHALEHENPGSAPYAYDVVTAIVCAPDAHSISHDVQGNLTMRDVLQAKAEDWKRIQKRDPSMAETVVRLYRRVDAQMAPPPPPPDVVVGAMEEDGLAMAMAAQVEQQQGVNQSNLDAMSLDTAALDGLGSAAASVVGGLDMGADDMFSGLQGLGGDFGNDFASWGDSMEL